MDQGNEAAHSSERAIVLRIEERLYETYRTCADRAIKALFFLNSGGAVTILTYQKAASKNSFSVPLRIFLVGLVAIFIMVAIDYFLVLNIRDAFKKNALLFLEHKLSFPQFQNALERKEWFRVALFLGIISGVSVVVGIIWGLTLYSTMK